MLLFNITNNFNNDYYENVFNVQYLFYMLYEYIKTVN